MPAARHTFTDKQWQRIELSMPPCKGRPGGRTGRFSIPCCGWPARAPPGATCPSSWDNGTWCTGTTRLVRQGALRASFPGRATARHGRGDGGFDLLPGRIRLQQALARLVARRPYASRVVARTQKFTPSSTPRATRCALCCAWARSTTPNRSLSCLMGCRQRSSGCQGL